MKKWIKNLLDGKKENTKEINPNSKQEFTEFESKLGNVAVAKEHVERKPENQEQIPEWDALKTHFHEQKLINEIHFSEIEKVRYDEGSPYPHVKITTKKGEEKLLFFLIGEKYKECYQKIRENLNVYRQRH